MMVGLFSWVKKKTCKHRFAYEDLVQTIIKEPPDPGKKGTLKEWEAYWKMIWSYKHPSFTHRIYWPCDKCGKVFYAHCGLDIISTHGEVFWRKNEKKI